MEFRHESIDPEPPGESNVICLTCDLTGTGRDDVIVGAKEGDWTLYWYENHGDGEWERHGMSTQWGLEAGGVVADVDGDGDRDVIAGQKWDAHEAYWFENPGDPRERWEAHLIMDEYQKYHDQGFGDVDDDGEPEVVLLSQKAGVLVYYDVPADPRTSPWPEDHKHVVSEDVWDVEGIQIVDIDGDGDTEIVAGRNVFSRVSDGTGSEKWDVTARLAPEWEDERVRVQIADLDGDGEYEAVLSECELPFFGDRRDIDHDGRVAVCSGPDWTADVLMDGLYCPHSLQIADFDGDGRLDIFVGESFLGENENPQLYVFENVGDLTFEPHLIAEGTPTHEAKVADLTGDGTADIVGKDDWERGHVDAWYNETR